MLPVIADLVRSGFVEGHHYGSVLALGADGAPAYERGDVRTPILPRSCSKPLQALGMVRAGLDLDGELLALACASHSGEPFHLDAVRRILAGAGLDESALANPPGWPLTDAAQEDLIRSGGSKSVLAMNCSGKHAAMLATCVANDWPTEGYLDPAHPLQQQIAAVFAEVTGEPVAHVAVDGCGAPLLATSLTGLARAFAHLSTSDRPEERRIAAAIRTHPEYVSGTARDERALLTAIPGAIGKAGAEACYAVALADGRAFALKVDDGGARARPVVMAGLLRHLGVDTEPGVDTEAVRRTGAAPLHGGGKVVGEIRPVL
ncbi:asparaginase [Nocardioides marmoriginsengisoli]|uniref:Asparaginase n=1 Tax=Nocardioides marmoriginsengisoli TaxID=661483 RepID=A0A3N0CS51_9ACTN|nr:asparaginase [Nocardioides marmoriginsengisoli]RNL66101.1 asparaginase [Nocardioides marmoriginsengisoli]